MLVPLPTSNEEPVVSGRFLRILVAAALVMPAIMLGTAAAAQEQQWDTLGNVRLKPGGWENTVEVLNAKVVNEIRIDVDTGDLDMTDLRLAFDNGTVWASGKRLEFREGSRSTVIRLPYASHRIRRVGFTYKNHTGDVAPLVEIYGRLAAAVRTEAAWVHLGARNLNMAHDQGIIEVTRDDEVRTIQFWTDSNEVDLSKVTITFSSGEVVSLPSPVPVGLRRGRVVELPGDGGVVRRIAFTYRSPFGVTQGTSTLHVYGRP
jgi:hypothetical protein